MGLVSHQGKLYLTNKAKRLICFLVVIRVDQAGVICKQEGIFRVNCMDCLDRTNVVQAAFARVVMEQQVTPLFYLGLSSVFCIVFTHFCQ